MHHFNSWQIILLYKANYFIFDMRFCTFFANKWAFSIILKIFLL